jgi:hypothetical protein
MLRWPWQAAANKAFATRWRFTQNFMWYLPQSMALYLLVLCAYGIGGCSGM